VAREIVVFEAFRRPADRDQRKTHHKPGCGDPRDTASYDGCTAGFFAPLSKKRHRGDGSEHQTHRVRVARLRNKTHLGADLEVGKRIQRDKRSNERRRHGIEDQRGQRAREEVEIPQRAIGCWRYAYSAAMGSAAMQSRRSARGAASQPKGNRIQMGPNSLNIADSAPRGLICPSQKKR
jgi:hypothetical protein